VLRILQIEGKEKKISRQCERRPVEAKGSQSDPPVYYYRGVAGVANKVYANFSEFIMSIFGDELGKPRYASQKGSFLRQFLIIP
jgi:hypothetical protein